MTLSRGDRLGRYEVLGPIGSGGMGEVWRARDTELGREVAVKVLPEDVASEPRRVERFRREARALAALSHPNLLEIHDVGSTNGLDYVVTELLEGDSLRAAIPPKGLPWQKVAEIGAAAADGLAAAHGRGIIHRDLKPEQLRGRPATAQSDIFSLGCVMYEMASGRRAFSGNTGAELYAAILKEEPPQLSSSGATVPVDLERIVHRCLEKRPEARSQSAADLAHSLKSLGSSPSAPVMATPSAVRSVGARRWRWWQVAVASLLLIVAAGIAWRTLMPGGGEAPVELASTLDPNRVAVVPFTNRTGDSALDTLRHQAADEIAGQLSEMEDLEVVPPSAVASELAAGRTESDLDPRALVADVADGTSAGLVFTGVIDAAGTGIELRGVLEDTIEGQVVRPFAPVAADPTSPGRAMRDLAKEVYISTSDHLHPSLAFGAGEEWPDVETYREFVKRLRLLDRENSLPFLELFQANPQLTRIRLKVAGAFLNNLRLRTAREILNSEHLDEANLNRHQAAVTRALRLWADGQYDVAYRFFRDELTDSPRDTFARQAAARCALFANRPAAAIALYLDRVPDRAVPVAVDMLMAADAAASHHMLDKDRAAFEVLDRARSDAPSSTLTDWCLRKQISLLGATGETGRIETLLEEAMGRDFGRYEIVMARIDASHELRAHGFRDASVAMAGQTLEFLAALCGGPPESCPALAETWLKAFLIAGRDEEAAALAADLESEALSWIPAWCLSGIAAARVGDTTTARRFLERLADLPADSDPRYDMTRIGDLRVAQAMIAAQLGNLDEALYLLRTGITGGALRVEHNLNVHELRHNIFLEPLWKHPEFQEIMRPKG